MEWNFLTKFCDSDQCFRRNILSSLHLKPKTPADVEIANTHYHVLFTNFVT